MKRDKFEVYKAKNNEWAFRFKSKNGQIMFQGETYKKQASVIRAIKSIHKKLQGKKIKIIKE